MVGSTQIAALISDEATEKTQETPDFASGSAPVPLVRSPCGCTHDNLHFPEPRSTARALTGQQGGQTRRHPAKLRNSSRLLITQRLLQNLKQCSCALDFMCA
jgi:hypothetical protein